MRRVSPWCGAPIFVGGVLTSVIAVGVRPDAAVEASADAPIRDAEAALAAALLNHDESAWTALTTPDYLDVDSGGQLRDRMEAFTGGASKSLTHVAVHRHDSVAIVVGRADDERVLRVWIRRDEHWRVASEQAVTIQPGALDPEPPAQVLANAPVAVAFHADSPAIVADVLRAQDALDAANAAGDPTAFARLTVDDFVVVTTHGLVRTKRDRVIESRIAQLEARPQRPVPRRDDVRVRVFGTTAIITARNWPRTFEGTPRAPSRYMRVWTRAALGWQQIANISTLALDP